MIFQIILLSLFATSICSYDLLVEITAGIKPVGIFFPGQNIEDHEVYKFTVPEHFLQTIDANGTTIEAVNYNTALSIRSSDLTTRVLIDFHQSPQENQATHPYQLTFYNLAIGDRGGDKPIELKHADAGYLWIDGGHHVSHLTGPVHKFTVRDVNREDVFTVSLAPAPEDEL